MNNTRTTLIIFLFRAPQILKGTQRGQNGTTDPNRILALRRRDNLDFHASRRKRSQFLLHAISNTWEHGRSSRQHDVSIEITTDIEIALEDGVVPGSKGVIWWGERMEKTWILTWFRGYRLLRDRGRQAGKVLRVTGS